MDNPFFYPAEYHVVGALSINVVQFHQGDLVVGAEFTVQSDDCAVTLVFAVQYPHRWISGFRMIGIPVEGDKGLRLNSLAGFLQNYGVGCWVGAFGLLLLISYALLLKHSPGWAFSFFLLGCLLFSTINWVLRLLSSRKRGH
jgi:hypothetical protein